MTQYHPYDADLAYHFINLALTAEIHPLWENDDPNHEKLDDFFAIPRPYYDRIFVADIRSAHDLYADIHDYVQSTYGQIGVIRVGNDIVPDYDDVDAEWVLDDLTNFQNLFRVMQSYSQRFSEAFSNTVRYAFSNLLLGYAFRSKRDGHGVVVMRGTVSFDEWLNNMNYRLRPFHAQKMDYGLVHTGFRDVYKGIRGAYHKLIEEFDTDTDIYLVGHSLGAAVSQLAAFDLSLKYPERAERLQVYGFGSPRVGDRAFAKAYDETVKTSYRVVNVCDLIPYVPFSEMGDVLNQDIDYPYTETKGELSYAHQAGNPIANHIASYHVATKHNVPSTMDLSFPRRVT